MTLPSFCGETDQFSAAFLTSLIVPLGYRNQRRRHLGFRTSRAVDMPITETYDGLYHCSTEEKPQFSCHDLRWCDSMQMVSRPTSFSMSLKKNELI